MTHSTICYGFWRDIIIMMNWTINVTQSLGECAERWARPLPHLICSPFLRVCVKEERSLHREKRKEGSKLCFDPSLCAQCLTHYEGDFCDLETWIIYHIILFTILINHVFMSVYPLSTMTVWRNDCTPIHQYWVRSECHYWLPLSHGYLLPHVEVDNMTPT